MRENIYIFCVQESRAMEEKRRFATEFMLCECFLCKSEFYFRAGNASSRNTRMKSRRSRCVVLVKNIEKYALDLMA